jgi:urea transport system permease protein
MKTLVSLHTRKQWLGLLAASVIILIVPALPLPDHWMPLLGKFLCFALVAVAMDLVWGYTGVLSLGHAVFFSLGGYAMGMYLMRSIGKEGVYRSELPDFMVFLDWKELPWYWHGFDNFAFAMAMVVIVPGVLAFIFGFFAFRSRIKGVYFSIITQALTYAFMLLMFRNDTGFGGNNGLTDFKRLLGYPLADPSVKKALYVISAIALLIGYMLCRVVVMSKLGRVLLAVRDAEGRVMFSGYNPLPYKLFAWTMSAVLCGVAGALYVPQVGIINPSELAPANSIEIAIWVAIGGRSTLVGGVIGAFIVNGMKSYLTAAYPDLWLFALGAVFILVTLFLPEGVVGLVRKVFGAKDKDDIVVADESAEAIADEITTAPETLNEKNMPSRA